MMHIATVPRGATDTCTENENAHKTDWYAAGAKAESDQIHTHTQQTNYQ
jgi:hypothetical protein